MPFAFDDDQRALADGVESLLAARATGAYARAVAAGGADWLELWHAVAELGVPGMAAPEDRGGLGLGPVELVAVCERAGRYLAPCPLVSTAGGFVPAATASGAECLEGIATEGRAATLAWLDRRSPGARVELSGDRLRVEGLLVPDAERVELLGFPIGDGRGEWSLAVLPRERARIEPVDGFDRTRPLARVAVDGEEAAVAALPRGIDDLGVAFVTAAAEMVGMAARMLELSVEHARERQQFGSPIGAFQGVKHRLADAQVRLESARSLAYRAAVLAAAATDRERDPAALRAARMAKAAASDAATEVGRSAVQVHGGLGITVEHDVSLFYLRARQASMNLGGSDEHYAAVGARGATG